VFWDKTEEPHMQRIKVQENISRFKLSKNQLKEIMNLKEQWLLMNKINENRALLKNWL
jgi:hypothetical protein